MTKQVTKQEIIETLNDISNNLNIQYGYYCDPLPNGWLDPFITEYLIEAISETLPDYRCQAILDNLLEIAKREFQKKHELDGKYR